MQHIRPAIVMMILVMTLITGLLYPLGLYRPGAGPSFPHQAAGSLVTVDGKVIGSELIGQNFAERQIFSRSSVCRRQAAMMPPTPRVPTMRSPPKN